MFLFRSEPDNRHYAKLLLPEIAEVLGVTVAQLERKPIDIQIMLAQKYVDCWHSGQADIKEVLERDILFLSEPEKDKNRLREMNKLTGNLLLEIWKWSEHDE